MRVSISAAWESGVSPNLLSLPQMAPSKLTKIYREGEKLQIRIFDIILTRKFLHPHKSPTPLKALRFCSSNFFHHGCGWRNIPFYLWYSASRHSVVANLCRVGRRRTSRQNLRSNFRCYRTLHTSSKKGGLQSWANLDASWMHVLPKILSQKLPARPPPRRA